MSLLELKLHDCALCGFVFVISYLKGIHILLNIQLLKPEFVEVLFKIRTLRETWMSFIIRLLKIQNGPRLHFDFDISTN